MQKKFPESAKRLKSLRDSHNIKSHIWLADKLTIERNRLYRLETGQYLPDAEEILKYAKYFKVSLAWVITGEETENMDLRPKGTLEDILERLSGIESELDIGIKRQKRGNPEPK